MDSMVPRDQPAGGDHVRVGEGEITAAELVARVASGAAGAVCLFLGTVRDHSEGRPGVTHLEYEAYGDVVEAKIAEIAVEAHGRWDIVAVAAEHRLGDLAVEEVSVGIAVGAAHRTEAFAAAQYVIDELKRRVPIWKKEHWPGGAEWVQEGSGH